MHRGPGSSNEMGLSKKKRRRKTKSQKPTFWFISQLMETHSNSTTELPHMRVLPILKNWDPKTSHICSEFKLVSKKKVKRNIHGAAVYTPVEPFHSHRKAYRGKATSGAHTSLQEQTGWWMRERQEKKETTALSHHKALRACRHSWSKKKGSGRGLERQWPEQRRWTMRGRSSTDWTDPHTPT